MIKKNMLKFGIVFMFALSLLVLAACGKEVQTEEENAIAVEVDKAVVTDMEAAMVLSGTLTAKEDVSIIPKVSGTIAKVYVSVGDKVSKGQTLVALDKSDLQTQLAQAKSAYNEASTNLQRMQNLYNEGAISLQQLESARGAVERSGLDSAAAAVQMVRDQMNNMTITSPINGVVAAVNAQAGEMAGQQMPIVQVVNMNTVEVKTAVTEANINKISANKTVPVTVASAGNTVFNGKVESIAPAADAQTMTYPVVVTIPNAEHVLKPGMFAEIKLSTQKKAGVIAIPKVAISGIDVVYVVRDNKATAVNIEKGIENDSFVEVLSGIAEGDVVVTKGQNLLYDGALVRIVEPQA